MTSDEPGPAWLEGFLARHGGVAGTVHRARGQDLQLVAHRNIPARVLEVVSWVPHGKGMAGQAQVRARPVQTCNLQTDASGDVNPLARQVSAQAAVALPVLDDDGAVCAVVGIAFPGEGELAAEQVESLMRDATTLPWQTL